MVFVHDNARFHTSNIVKQFLSKKDVQQIEYPLYSPDLNPSNFFLFPRLKLDLKGKRFDAIPDIQRSVTRFCTPSQMKTCCKVSRTCITGLRGT
ncbi:hypothetical protein TNCV_1145681 [Trichonephila clavipes]|nr:hypothetical protein TNCV_1145681 [Trichonephila clavipes]